jgi:hypothetical protein
MDGGSPMNAGKVNSWLTLGANVGVVVGLMLIIVEIGQNTEMMRAQINQSRTDTALFQQYSMSDTDYIAPIVAKIRRGEQLSDEEMLRYDAHMRAFNRNQDNNLWQYNQGYLGENIPASIRGGVRAVIGQSELSVATWDYQKYSYTNEYVAFVEKAIKDLR